MPSHSRATIVGRLVHDPELKTISSGKAVLEITVAINQRVADGKTEPCYVDCEFWERRAETVAKHFRKGDPILVEGRLRQKRWQTQGGQKRSRLIVRADGFEFIDTAKREQPAESVDDVADEDIPF